MKKCEVVNCKCKCHKCAAMRGYREAASTRLDVKCGAKKCVGKKMQ